MRISFFEKRRWNNFANVIPMVLFIKCVFVLNKVVFLRTARARFDENDFFDDEY